jgi:hypothetical protein
MIRQIRAESIRDNSLQDGSDNSDEFLTTTAKAIEFWFNTTALGASGDYDFFIETSMGKLNDAATAIWSQQGDTLNIAATGVVNVLINRIDHALGERFRVRWAKNTTTITFDLKAAILE